MYFSIYQHVNELDNLTQFSLLIYLMLIFMHINLSQPFRKTQALEKNWKYQNEDKQKRTKYLKRFLGLIQKLVLA